MAYHGHFFFILSSFFLLHDAKTNFRLVFMTPVKRGMLPIVVPDAQSAIYLIRLNYSPVRPLTRLQTMQGKPLAIPYARAVHEMVPVTKLAVERGAPQPPHESINDLPAHRLTEPQIFYPVSESRQFNRVDAGRVFSGAPLQNPEEAERITSDPGAATLRITQRPKTIERVGKGDEEHQVLQPADVRIPHPHLISYHRDRLAMPNEKHEWARRYQERIQKDEAARQERKQFAKAKEEKHTRKVQPENSRFEFRFSDVVVSKETTGADGRGHAAPGRRYGVPNYDRSKGQIKIPKRVDV